MYWAIPGFAAALLIAWCAVPAPAPMSASESNAKFANQQSRTGAQARSGQLDAGKRDFALKTKDNLLVRGHSLSALQKAHAKRIQLAVEHSDRMVSAVYAVTSDQGVEAFVSEAHSLKSAGLLATSQERHRAWIRQLFLEYVFPVGELRDVIRSQGERLVGALAAVDNEVLVELQFDVEFDPSSLECEPIDLGALDSLIDKSVDAVVDEVYAATVNSATSFAVGTGVGVVGHGIARDALKDDSGQVSLGNEILATLIGLGVDFFASEIAEQTLQPREELRRVVVAQTNQLLATARSEGPVGVAILESCARCAGKHSWETANAVARWLKVDSDWVAQTFDEVE